MIVDEIDTLLLVLYLSVIMGFKSIVNCDVQRLLKKTYMLIILPYFVDFCF